MLTPIQRATRLAAGFLATLLLAAMLPAGVGCRKPEVPVPNPRGSTQEYPVRGTVESVSGSDETAPQIVLKHEAIPGLMGAMTMPYSVDEAVRSELHRGDRITATVEVDRLDGGVSINGLKNAVVIAQAQPDYKPQVQYHVPAAGEAVPDFALTNQSGKTIRLAQFQGKVLLLTFVYTRCPLPDFCPKMSRNFAEIDKALASEGPLYAKTHLLTASFDPAFDTPAVLRSYGGAATGRFGRETFAHWDFAVPGESELPRLEQWFDLGVTAGKGGAWQHSLSTVVIGADGKVVAFYATNDWSVSEVLALIRKAAETKKG